MSDYEIHDERFDKLIVGHAKLERLWTGSRWAEGPVYVPAARQVLWSDIPNNRVLRFVENNSSVSVFETPCGFQNGHAVDSEGRVIACEHGGRRISRLDHDGIWRALATHFEGKRLNSPNDVVVKSDGTIWFSDPTYGIDGYYEGALAESEIGAADVYRLDPASGEVTAVARDRVRPNGLAFSPDESILYVADTGETPSKTRRAPSTPMLSAPTVKRSPTQARSPFATTASSTASGSTCTATCGRPARIPSGLTRRTEP